jgi:dTDP-4-dehydrorhamnose reductase
MLQQLQQKTGQERAQAFGTYHLTASLRCSWREFAEAIMHGARAAGLIGKLPRVIPIASADYPTPARRPQYSVLDNARLARVFGLQLPPWQDGLREVIAELAAAHPIGDSS